MKTDPHRSVLWRMLTLNIHLLWKRSKSQTLFLLLMAAMPGVFNALSVPALEAFIRGIEQAAQGAGMRMLVWGAAALCGANVLFRAVDAVCMHVQMLSQERVKADLTAMLMRAFSRKEPICFEDPAVLDSIEKAYDGVEKFGRMNLRVFNESLYTLAYLAVMLVYLASRSMVLVAVLLVSILPMIVVQQKIQDLNKSFEDKRAAMKRQFDYCESCIAGRETYKETRLLGAFSYFFDRYQRHIRDYCHFRVRHILREKTLDVRANVLSMAGFAVMLAVLIVELTAGRLETASFAALFSSLMLIYTNLMYYFANVFMAISREQPGIENLFKALDLPERPGAAREADGLKGVTMENVHFTYPGAQKESVRGVTLSIAPRETIAIVGENGAGKTTLVRLLTGLYLPTEGTVKIGGEDTRGIDLPSAVKHLSAVFQKYMRYPLTLKENVRISDAEREDPVEGVLSQAGLCAEADCFPQGSDTMLSREFDGVDLSGGQWQRVAIARGLYRAHGLIVLDEPTAAIDPLEETRVYQKFAQLSRGRTAVIVTHRMGSARIADRILVMADGRIAETGTHDELMARCGLYAHMVEAQAEWYQ